MALAPGEDSHLLKAFLLLRNTQQSHEPGTRDFEEPHLSYTSLTSHSKPKRIRDFFSSGIFLFLRNSSWDVGGNTIPSIQSDFILPQDSGSTGGI